MSTRRHSEKMARHSDLANAKRKAYRQDEGAALLAEWMGDGHPLSSEVMGVLLRLKLQLGVQVTREHVAEAIAEVQEKYRDTDLADIPVLRLTAPLQRAPKRFGQIGPREEVVYYMRVGNRVKIGTTINLRHRLATLSPEELMATELGGTSVERHRHAQFKHLRTAGEWFKLEGALAEHIDKLRDTTR